VSLWWALCGAAWREHPGRVTLALLAIALGVALAFGVHLLNGAALLEFSRAARAVNGQPDLVIRSATAGPLHDADLAALLARPEVLAAAPVLEALGRHAGVAGQRAQTVRLIGIDALALLGDSAPLAPDLIPHIREGGWQALVDPRRWHPNASARRLLEGEGLRLRLATPAGARDLLLPGRDLGGEISASGSAVIVLDIAAAQAAFGRPGELDRIDLRLADSSKASALRAALPAHLLAEPPADEAGELADLTRAYRVNLGLLSLMALFTGGFLVFAVLSLSAAQRLPQWALAGVLGLSARQRLGLMLAEGALLGLVGSALGLLLGLGLAAGALQLLGSNLGLATATSNSLGLLTQQPLLAPTLSFGLLGLAVAVLAALGPALAVRRIAPAQVLKGLGTAALKPWPIALGPLLLAAGVGLALLKPPASGPLAGVAVGAYLGLLALLLGGLALVPTLLRGATALLERLPLQAVRQLAAARQRDQAGEARRTIAGVLTALALSVAMLVMIGSFRESLSTWLDQVLGADLYVRSSLRTADEQAAPLSAEVLALARTLPAQTEPQRSTRAWLDGQPDAIPLQAREIDEARLPWVAGPVPAPKAVAGAAATATNTPVYLNEAGRDRLGLRLGQQLTLRLRPGAAPVPVYVRGIWRDYARQSGALWMAQDAYSQAGGDAPVTELSIRLAPGAEEAAVRRALGALPDVEVASSTELRTLSLQIFDRSFAITAWLQGVALAVGLFGVAAGASAQALARQREFGLLRHLGFSQAELRQLLWLEAGLLSAVGALAGLALGLALSAVLVFVVNPQSFHWTLEMHLPLRSLSLLLVLAFAASAGASVLAGRRAIGADAVRAVKEDW
jgi:putative ABC transport system permease protein